ncbi:MAG TPA: sulfotransferase domain-containing protein [Candidatus Brocadiaceae bacterium]
MLLPKFVVIGAPRSNTRWLAQCLSEHPEIALPPQEVYFFTTRRVVSSNWSKGLEWYSKLFEKCVEPRSKTWGEVTPVYLFDEDTPHLMYQCIPDAKLICCLRDQSQRAYSWYRLFLRFNPDLFGTDYSFKKFLTYHNDVYGREGFYLEHLQRYLSLYSGESMLILLNDDLKIDPIDYVQKVYHFLGVDSAFVPSSVNKHINPMNPEVPKSKTLQKISTYIEQSYKLRKLGLDKVSDVINRINTLRVSKDDYPLRHQLDPEMRARMADLYQEHNKKLGDFLGRDLSHWNCEPDKEGAHF